jgi:uncharacterized protein
MPMPELQQWRISQVVHNAAEQRFELGVENELCVLNYRRTAKTLVIYHTEVPQPFEGHGLAARMTRAALEFARSENLRVEPNCSYSAAFMRKHPEFNDLLLPR